MSSSNFSNTRRNLIKASAATALLPSAAFAAKKHKYGIVGYQAPELTVDKWIDGNGNEADFKMADQRGKFVYMKFWQYWCPGCHAHGFPGLKTISDGLKDNKHFVALSIQTTFEGHSTNTSNKMVDIQKKYDLQDLIMGHEAGKDKEDGHPSTMRNYRSGGTPWAVLISPTGAV